MFLSLTAAVRGPKSLVCGSGLIRSQMGLPTSQTLIPTGLGSFEICTVPLQSSFLGGGTCLCFSRDCACASILDGLQRVVMPLNH